LWNLQRTMAVVLARTSATSVAKRAIGLAIAKEADLDGTVTGEDPDPLVVALVRPAGTMAGTRGTMAGTVVVILVAGTIAGMTVAGTPGTTAGMVTVGTTTVATTVAETTRPHVATQVLLLVVVVVQDARPALVQATAAPPTASPVSDLPALTIVLAPTVLAVVKRDREPVPRCL